MEVQLVSGFLPLLFLAWLPTGTLSQPEEPGHTIECKVELSSQIKYHQVQAKCCKCAGLEVRNQTDATALAQDATNVTCPGMCLASTEVCKCVVFITRINLTDTGNGTKGTVLSCGPEAPQTNVTEKKIWTELTFLLCIVFGLAIGTLLYMPVIGILLWHCRRNRKGELTSRQAVEGNQLSMAAAEDLTYANLKFEKGTKPPSSDVVYTEVKPPHGKPHGEDAKAGVDVLPKGEGK